VNEPEVADATALPEQVAAVDLGSNSFHMVVATPAHGGLHVVDRLRERVALAEGLNEERRLTPEAMQRALECLERFGQRLRSLPPEADSAVRAVGTSALRRARNAHEFLDRAEATLGYPVEVIAGLEEARLIYLGVSHTHGDLPARRLVVDVGGGSTEVILGEGSAPLFSDSLHMGCVGYTRRFFPDGRITRERMSRARLAASLEVEGLTRAYRAAGWDGCIGASGTIMAVQEILAAGGWTNDDTIPPKGLARLRRALVQQGHVDRLDLPGLQADRKPVIAGGVAILCALFGGLGIESMQVTTGALREGLLYDLFGRLRHGDLRDATIRSLCERYHIDTDHAARVLATAMELFEQVRRPWKLERQSARQALSWAAQLSEIGLSIAFSGHHRHGAYILANADLPGFSRTDQELLSALIRCHRRKPRPAAFDELPQLLVARRVCCLLRLAVLLHRSRSTHPLPALKLRAKDAAVELQFPAGWLDAHPLTSANLADEAGRLRLLGFELEFR